MADQKVDADVATKTDHYEENDLEVARDEELLHNEDKPWDWRTRIAVASLCVLWVGSQIPLYFIGGCLAYVSQDIGGKAITQSSWIPVSNTLALAAVAPVSGYLTDIFGRRNITLMGCAAINIGVIIVATSHSFAQIIAGMVLAGAGAGIGELTALSGVAELVPVKKRGQNLAFIVAVLTPVTPYVLYSQLFSTRTQQGWRWGQWISLIWNTVALIGILSTYFPERNDPRRRSEKASTLHDVDWAGAFMSITGITLFLIAVQSGGFTHPWSSAFVLSTMIIGIVLIIAFIVWEWKGAKYPMIPRELFAGQRIVAVTFLLAFVAGMDFYSLINFFPLTFETLFPPIPIQIGLKGLGYGISVTAGAVVVNFLLTVFPKHNKELLLGSCVMMTAFIGALAAVTPETPRLDVALGTIGGFGVGGILVPATTVATTACPDELIGTTVALSLSIRVIGGSIGYSIYYNIFASKLKQALPVSIATAAINVGLPQSEVAQFVEIFVSAPTNVSSVKGVTATIISAATRGSQEAYALSFRYVWFSSIAFGCLAVIAALSLESNSKFLTGRVAAHIRS